MNAYAQEHAVNQFGSFMAGLLVGGLSGAGAMLLMAPQSGKKTRTQIQQQGIALSKQTTEAVEHALTQVRGKAREITDEVHDQAETLGQRGQKVIDEQRDNLGQGLRDLGKAVHS